MTLKTKIKSLNRISTSGNVISIRSSIDYGRRRKRNQGVKILKNRK